jgi:pimeloyl-ACP methyl ester carboxylesterase
MTSTSARSDKSTSVRANRPAMKTARSLRMLRGAFAWLAPRAPSAAALLAERLFRTPPPYRGDATERDALFFADVETIPFGTKELSFWSFGEGPTVLLVHGWGGRGTQLRAFVDPLVRAGFRAVLFDAPGHSGAPFEQTSLPELGAAVKAILRAIGPVHGVIAHSMGCAATTIALEQPHDAMRIVFIAPPADMTGATARFGRVLDLPDEVVDLMERRIEAQFLRPMADYSVPKSAARMHDPLLVVHDHRDREVPFEDGARVARAWPGAELFATSGLGHVKILRAPAIVERALGFIACDQEGTTGRANGAGSSPRSAAAPAGTH